jgi:regulator of cell morphogenesis and NO signaling
MMHFTRDMTVGEIVAGDFRTAAVFQELGIDFCCGGRRGLGDACRARHLDEDAVMTALERVCDGPDSSARFDTWSPEQLIGHIVAKHHAYVRRAMPSLIAYTRKLAAVHGIRHPELVEIAAITEDIAEEMTSHMAKEERVLFPYIVALSEAVRQELPVPWAPFGTVDGPIRMMKEDHDWTGAAVARIRELTNGFAVPDDGCTTYRVCLEELNAFERDLHEHVHLENNMLFPAARKLASAGATA